LAVFRRYLDEMKCSTSTNQCTNIVASLLTVACLLLTVALGITFAKLKGAEKKMADLESQTEAAKESFFNEGYDKGYQSAIVDAYTGAPLYMIAEPTGDDQSKGAALWKKVELDEVNQSKLVETPSSEEEDLPELN
jgi:hypothetical protein